MTTSRGQIESSRRPGGVMRALGSVVGAVGTVVVGIAVAIGAMVYLVVAWGQHRRRISDRVG